MDIWTMDCTYFLPQRTKSFTILPLIYLFTHMLPCKVLGWPLGAIWDSVFRHVDRKSQPTNPRNTRRPAPPLDILSFSLKDLLLCIHWHILYAVYIIPYVLGISEINSSMHCVSLCCVVCQKKTIFLQATCSTGLWKCWLISITNSFHWFLGFN